MAKSVRGRRRLLSRQFRPTPYPIPDVLEREAGPKKTLERKDWEDATCSVCMEFPHNAVLLLCSSHDKGCRPYMCGTSYRHSNCLDQFKKAYAVLDPAKDNPLTELICPLCRGRVKGWTVVEPARECLDNKKRSCMQDGCSFAGTYKDLRKHLRSEHPSAKPREVDPLVEQKWRLLEHERERQDVISTIRSSVPGSVVLGDYVIEMNNTDLDNANEAVDDGEFDGGGVSRNILYFFLREGARLMRLHRDEEDEDDDEEAFDNSSNGYIPLGDDDDDDAIAVYSEDGVAPVNERLRSNRRRRRRSRGGLG